MRLSKYKNIPTIVDGIRFSSKLEARRYGELKLLERTGEIRKLEFQPKFPITIDGNHITNVIGDFAYFEKGKRVVEDTKGFVTALGRIKEKLVRACYPGIDWRIIN